MDALRLRDGGLCPRLLILASDTPEELKIGVRRVAKFLPRYRRIALERMDDLQTRARGGLS